MVKNGDESHNTIWKKSPTKQIQLFGVLKQLILSFKAQERWYAKMKGFKNDFPLLQSSTSKKTPLNPQYQTTLRVDTFYCQKTLKSLGLFMGGPKKDIKIAT